MEFRNSRMRSLRLVWVVMLAMVLVMTGCAAGKKSHTLREKVEYPAGYLSSYYDAFQKLYLNSDNHTAAGFDELVRRYPDSAEAHLMRADAYMKMGNYDEARRSIDRSVELDSMNAAAYSKRIEIRMAQREPLQSFLEDELKCVRLDSTNTEYVRRLLFHLHDAGMYDRCISFAQSAYSRHNIGGVIDVILSSCFLRKDDREEVQKYLARFAEREDTSPGMNGFALMSASMLGDDALIELFYSRAKQGGCVSALNLTLIQAYLKHKGRLDEAFKEGATMVAQCDYDTNDIERVVQSFGPVGILDSSAMATGLQFADLLLQRYSRSSVVLGFAETMYRKVKDDDRTYALLRKTAELDSGDFLRWVMLLQFEDQHKRVNGKWEARTEEEFKTPAVAFPLARWSEMTETLRYVLRRFPNSVAVIQYLARVYAVTGSYDVARDSAYHYIDYYRRCLKRAGKHDTIYYRGAVWEPKLPARVAYKRAISSIYGFVGDQYMTQNLRESAYSEYKEGLRYNPDNAMLLNNYAYFLAKYESKSRLREAERMSKRSVELEPKNGTYLDSYAYILYLKGDYAGAKELYAKLFSLGAVESPEIYRNYSELLDAMGNKTTAEVYRMKAKVLEERR